MRLAFAVTLFAVVIAITASCSLRQADGPPPSSLPEVRVMSWNIWHGGREDGAEVGVRKVIDVIASSGADIVAMAETYGSGEAIAQSLGFHFHPRGTNVALLSRWPVIEDLSVHEPFQCVGGLIGLPDGRRLAVYSLWLPYDEDIWLPGVRAGRDSEALRRACAASARELISIRDAIDRRLAAEEYAQVPIVIAGDFNSPSHLDQGEVAIDQYGIAVDWAASEVLARAGYRDAYRECRPVILRQQDATWSPRFPQQEQDRIDFVHYRSPRASPGTWVAKSADVLREHADGFPSDHAAVLVALGRREIPVDGAQVVRAVSYNIHHGEGVDGVLDLDRIAARLATFQADVIALQEVDLGVARTERRNQAAYLASKLGMHAAFGSFMPYQGGRYGMAVLSRWPLVAVRSLRLPDGNEPRISLIVDVRLPSDRVLTIADVHFDWVQDDSFRYAQAQSLVEHLQGRLRDDSPAMLVLGDFNDTPGSRTLDRFREFTLEAPKPIADSFTFPSTGADREIDFVFAAPASRWTPRRVSVADDPVASDHRPVFAELELRAPEAR
ncbi:MAG: endonuclease/exonuclease/phosphatase family protein [Planctomycetota bacterium]